MSTASTPWMGSRLSSSAPSGGAKMEIRPLRVWLNPARRVRKSFGTISEVEAVMAGLWKAPPSERTSMAA